MCTPPLTTVEVFPRSIGAEAGRLLLRRIEGAEETVMKPRLAPELLVSSSTGPAPRCISTAHAGRDANLLGER